MYLSFLGCKNSTFEGKDYSVAYFVNPFTDKIYSCNYDNVEGAKVGIYNYDVTDFRFVKGGIKIKGLKCTNETLC